MINFRISSLSNHEKSRQFFLYKQNVAETDA